MPKLFTPLYDKLLVLRDEEETVIAGGMGVHIPKDSGEKPDQGTVIEAGHGRLLENGQVVPMIVEVGDRILFHKFAGTDKKFNGIDYLIMSEAEVYGILPKEDVTNE